MNRSRGGWVIVLAGLGAVAVGVTQLVPDWRIRLGLDPAPEGVSEAPATGASDSAAPGAVGTASRTSPAEVQTAPDAAADATPADTAAPAATTEEAAAPATAAEGDAPAEPAAEVAAIPDAETPTEGATAEAGDTPSAGEAVPASDQVPGAAGTAEAADVPAFDLVRVDPEGEAVIAGTARPGAEVEVLIDGVVVASAVAGGDGSFVALASLGRSDRARALQLRLAGATAAVAEIEESALEIAAADPTTEAVASAGDGAATAPEDTTAGAEDAAASGTDQAAETTEPAQAGLSVPVVILPSADTAEAPVLVAPATDSVELLQPAASDPARVVLDRITYSSGGDAVAAGRARPGHAVRAYANAVFVTDAAVSADGEWTLTLPRAVAEGARLLRFDEVAASGEVTSRLETPFAYDDGAVAVETRQRRIVVQRGDNLWRIAEQHYGEGLRYSLIFSANSGLIRDPDLIYPGQVFAVPELIAAE